MKAERERREAEARAQEALRKAQMEAQMEEAPKAPEIPSRKVEEERNEEPVSAYQEAPRKLSITIELSHTDKAEFTLLSKYIAEHGFICRRIK